MNREEIEKDFDERFCILNKYSYRFKEINPDDVKDFFFDKIFPEVLRELQFDGYDIQTIGEHYWGGDYSPSYKELNGVAESMNNRFILKAKEKYNINL